MSSKLVKHRSGLPSLERRRLPQRLDTPPPPRSERSDTQLDLPGLYGFLGRMLTRRKALILTVAATVIVVTMVQVMTMTPEYRASTTIEITPDSGRVLPYKELSDAAEDFITTETYVQTQKEVIRSRALALRVVQRLGLDQDPEFNTKIHRGLLIDLPLDAKNWISDLLLPDDEDDTPDLDKYVDRLVEGLQVQVMVNTRLVEVDYSSNSPELSARILNTLVEELIEHEFTERFEATAKAREFLQRQLVDLKTAVDYSEAALKEYAGTRNIISIDGRQQVAIDKLVDLQQEMTALEARMIAERAYLQELKTSSIDNFPSSMTDDTLAQLQTQLSSLTQELASMSGRFGTDWPETRTVRRQVEEVKQQIETEKQKAVDKASRQYEASREQYNMLKEQLDREKRTANKLDQDMVQYNTLKQTAETNRELYDGVLQRLKELSVTTGMKSSNVRVLDQAGVPDEVSFPNIPYFAIVSTFLGLGLGMAGAFLVESLDNSLRTPDDLATALQLNCLGVIPEIELPREDRSGGPHEPDPDAAVNTLRHLTESSGWEAYRALRTSLVYSTLQPPPRSIMVTSPLAGDGRTFTTVNLAVALAQLGARVAVVDLDLRDPGVASMLGLSPKGRGISSYLAMDAGGDVFNYIRETKIPNLSIVPAGRIPPNPPELIGSDRMFGALDVLKEGFDVVLIDTPPVLEYTDAVVLAPMVDQVLVVVRGGVTSKRATQVGTTQLRSVRANLLGAVINAADMRDPEYAYRPGRGGARSKRAGRKASAGAKS